jgi:transmembrane sensor
MNATDSPQPSPASLIEGLAVEWAIRRSDGLTAAETAELLQWLAADPRHVAALGDAEKTACLLRRPRVTGTAGVVLRELQARQDLRRKRRRVIACSAAGLAVAASVFVAFFPVFRAHPAETTSSPVTVVVRPDSQTLADGSVVQLNAGAEIRVSFTPGRRLVELIRGEALFSVTSDPARPFVVAASSVEVRAVGTEFSVRRTTAAVDVLVTEGRVAVAHVISAAPGTGAAVDSPAAPESIYVAAGGRVSLPVVDFIPTPVSVQQFTPEQIAVALAWRNKRVDFTGTPLSEAVILFNRENRTQLAVVDPSLVSARISGVFWKDNPEAFASLLELTFDLKIERPSADRIILCRAR